MAKLNTKKLVLFALLGATWGVVEAQLGTLLHSAGIPFVGSFMIAISLVFLITGKYVSEFRASSVALALNASLIKFLFSGGIGLFPIMGILIQAMIYDFLVGGNFGKIQRYVLAGSAIVLYSLFHPFLTQGILGGMKILQVYAKLVSLGGHLLGFHENAGFLIFFLLVIFHMTIGAIASFVWFSLIVRLEANGLLSKVAKTT